MRTLQETRIIKQNGKGLGKYDRYNETGLVICNGFFLLQFQSW